VVDWYRRQGYEVVARNWRCRTGEIDIVAERSGVLVICEVKTRASDRFGSPAHAVTIDKQRRLRRLAVAWMSEHAVRDVVLRFDVACVVGVDGSCVVEVIEAAF
jgi:putative endonuclease